MAFHQTNTGCEEGRKKMGGPEGACRANFQLPFRHPFKARPVKAGKGLLWPGSLGHRRTGILIEADRESSPRGVATLVYGWRKC